MEKRRLKKRVGSRQRAEGRLLLAGGGSPGKRACSVLLPFWLCRGSAEGAPVFFFCFFLFFAPRGSLLSGYISEAPSNPARHNEQEHRSGRFVELLYLCLEVLSFVVRKKEITQNKKKKKQTKKQKSNRGTQARRIRIFLSLSLSVSLQSADPTRCRRQPCCSHPPTHPPAQQQQQHHHHQLQQQLKGYTVRYSRDERTVNRRLFFGYDLSLFVQWVIFCDSAKYTYTE